MKKTLLALGVAALCSGVQAQSSVQLMGTVDTFVGSIRNPGSARANVVNSGGMTTSWWGMKGTEDLGGGLKAGFALTGFFQADSGANTRLIPGDTFFSRDASVNLSGGFGTVTLGRALAPNFLPTIISNPFGDSFTFSPLVLHAAVPVFPTVGAPWIGTNPADTGWSNQIMYTTPSFGGLSANINYQFGEIANSSGIKNIGFNVLYFGGPLTLTGFYEDAEVANPTGGALAVAKKDWMVGGAYDFGPVKAFLTYGQAETATVDWKTTSLGASIPVGAGKVLLGYANTDVDAGADRKTYSVGYDYFLSKRTDVYAMYLHDKIDVLGSGSRFGVGIRHRF